MNGRTDKTLSGVQYGLIMLTHLRVEFSDLSRYHFHCKFNCNCACSLEDENNEHFLLRYPQYTRQRLILLNSISQLTNDVDITSSPANEPCNLLLYGHERYKASVNKGILLTTIKFIKESVRFKELEAYSLSPN